MWTIGEEEREMRTRRAREMRGMETITSVEKQRIEDYRGKEEIEDYHSEEQGGLRTTSCESEGL